MYKDGLKGLVFVHRKNCTFGCEAKQHFNQLLTRVQRLRLMQQLTFTWMLLLVIKWRLVCFISFIILVRYILVIYAFGWYHLVSFRSIRRIRVSTKFKDNHITSVGIRNLVINLRKNLRNHFVLLAGSRKGFTFGRVGFYGC